MIVQKLNGLMETKMSTKVIRLSEYNENNLSVSPEQAIQSLQKFLEENPSYNKVFLGALDNKKLGYFDVAWFRGNILVSEALAALDIAHDDLLRLLRGEEI